METITPLWERMPLQPFRQTDFMDSARAEQSEISFGKLFTDAVRNLSGADSAAGVVNDIFGANPITDIFASAADAVRETDTEKNQMEYLMATGQLDNPAPLLIAASKAQIAVDLMVQLRNRATDAYNELMRISL